MHLLTDLSVEKKAQMCCVGGIVGFQVRWECTSAREMGLLMIDDVDLPFLLRKGCSIYLSCRLLLLSLPFLWSFTLLHFRCSVRVELVEEFHRQPTLTHSICPW